MSKDASRVPGIRCTGRGGGTPSGPTGPLHPQSHTTRCRKRIKSPVGDSLRWQRGRDSNPRLTFLPATAFKAVPIGHSGTPPGRAVRLYAQRARPPSILPYLSAARRAGSIRRSGSTTRVARRDWFGTTKRRTSRPMIRPSTTEYSVDSRM